MNKNNLNQKARDASKDTAYKLVDEGQTTMIKASDVREAYKNVDEALSQMVFYKLIPLLNYEPQGCFSCCNWLINLTLSSAIVLYQMLYGSNFCTITLLGSYPKMKLSNYQHFIPGRCIKISLINTEMLPLFLRQYYASCIKI